MMRSDYAPERATAARMATNMVQSLDTTWTWIVVREPDDMLRRVRYAIRLRGCGSISDRQCVSQIAAVMGERL